VHLPNLSPWLLVLALAGQLGWTSDARAFNGKDVGARRIGGELNVSDSSGVRRKLADFRGKAVLIYFGYTHCPDVCPTTLLRMNEVLGLLGADAARVQVLWMTVDPERDTRALLSNYVPAFNPSFIALRGSIEETHRVTHAYEIQYQILHYNGQVLVDHSAHGYLLDRTGKVRVRLGYDMTAEQIAEDVRSILLGP
jgi:protein SCO1/2